jgi:hypothetical protein
LEPTPAAPGPVPVASRRRLVGKQKPAAATIFVPEPVPAPAPAPRNRKRQAAQPRADEEQSAQPRARKARSSALNICPYCGKRGVGEHRYQCKSAPWDVWVQGVVRRYQKRFSEAERDHLPLECRFCHTKYESSRPFGCHITQCIKRRKMSGLPC